MPKDRQCCLSGAELDDAHIAQLWHTHMLGAQEPLGVTVVEGNGTAVLLRLFPPHDKPYNVKLVCGRKTPIQVTGSQRTHTFFVTLIKAPQTNNGKALLQFDGANHVAGAAFFVQDNGHE